MGRAQKVGSKQQDLLAGRTVHAQKKKNEKGGKEHKAALGRKITFPFCKTFQAIKRGRCRTFHRIIPFNMNVSDFIVHFKCFYFI